MAPGKKARRPRPVRAGGGGGPASRKVETYSGCGVRFDHPAEMTVKGTREGEVSTVSAECDESPFLLIEIHPTSARVPDILEALYEEFSRGAEGEKWVEPEEKPEREIMGATRTGRALMAEAVGGKEQGGWVRKEVYALPARRHNLGVYLHYLTDERQKRLADRFFGAILGTLSEAPGDSSRGRVAPGKAQAGEARSGRKAVYAGSFDPVTNGHLYMIREGARLFDEFVVAVGTNPEKRYTFSAEERLEMLRAATAGMENVEVASMPEVYLVDFARSVGASYILRGVRNEHDFLNERTMRNVNSDLSPEVTTVFLMPPREIAEVSSSFVKGLVGPAGWERVIAGYLPPQVCEVFRRRFGK